MRIITLNCNGIRAAARKGFFQWMVRQKADVVCLQETRAAAELLKDRQFRPKGFFAYHAVAERKGYSGVSLYTRHEPRKMIDRLGWSEFDPEARYLEAVYDGVSIVSIYLPSGSSSEARQEAKFRYLDLLTPYLRSLRRKRREFVLCGDWNVAHKKIDLKNWRGNQKNSGFLPEERQWMDQLFGAAGFVDAFRAINDQPDQYTWWSNRGRAWEKNVGWRIDYQVITPRLRERVQSARIYKTKRFSDHAPLIIDYDWELGSEHRTDRAG